ncbi:MAG: DUF6448 family protein, partial [Candidatus Odinarchaeota archaeon]
AAKEALSEKNINLILPWVPEEAEEELEKIFKKTLTIREKGKESAELADLWFFENAVRLHRIGEGKGFTGLKPAGLDWGPIVPRADKAIENKNPNEVIDFLKNTIEDKLKEKFQYIMALINYDKNDVKNARKYVHAILDFTLFSNHLYKFLIAGKSHED